MNTEQKQTYIQKLMHDIQRARSVFYESNGGDTEHGRKIADSIGEMSEPWLFGKRCILPTLANALEGVPEDTLIVNLSSIAQHSQMLRIIGVGSKRKDPTIEEIFEVESDIEL